jgi:antitoxin component YwqK of YwqJK toxin-antitoxin module
MDVRLAIGLLVALVGCTHSPRRSVSPAESPCRHAETPTLKASGTNAWLKSNSFQTEGEGQLSVSYYPSGSVMSRGGFHDGRRNGSWASYYENGARVAEGFYRDDQPVGHWKTWYDNGINESEGDYVRGESAGLWIYWHKNGRWDRMGAYCGQRLVPPRNVSVPAESGWWTYWYENGQKRMEGSFVRGEKVGLWSEWAETGQLRSRKDFGPNDRPERP